MAEKGVHLPYEIGVYTKGRGSNSVLAFFFWETFHWCFTDDQPVLEVKVCKKLIFFTVRMKASNFLTAYPIEWVLIVWLGMI